MLVVVVDESEKRARVKSRRVISKWLPQIANTTWIGSLSKEGLHQLHDELLAKASKNTSICCFIAKSRWRFDVLWIVGHKQNWDMNGWFSYSQSKNIP